jgi:hypothetical protein
MEFPNKSQDNRNNISKPDKISDVGQLVIDAYAVKGVDVFTLFNINKEESKYKHFSPKEAVNKINADFELVPIGKLHTMITDMWSNPGTFKGLKEKSIAVGFNPIIMAYLFTNSKRYIEASGIKGGRLYHWIYETDPNATIAKDLWERYKKLEEYTLLESEKSAILRDINLKVSKEETLKQFTWYKKYKVDMFYKGVITKINAKDNKTTKGDKPIITEAVFRVPKSSEAKTEEQGKDKVEGEVTPVDFEETSVKFTTDVIYTVESTIELENWILKQKVKYLEKALEAQTKYAKKLEDKLKK